MADEQIKHGIPTRDFTDAGTGKSYKLGKPDEFEAGVFDNYFHAGLIEAPKPAADAEPKGEAEQPAD